MYRVVFPLELKLTNTTADADGADSAYALAGVVVHVGSGPTHGEWEMAFTVRIWIHDVHMNSATLSSLPLCGSASFLALIPIRALC